MAKRDRRSMLELDAEDEAPELSVVGGIEHAPSARKTEWMGGAAVREAKQPHAPVKELQSLAHRFGQARNGETIVSLDANLIDPSFVHDRLEVTDAEIAELAELIKVQGQLVPILVRNSPTDDSRYQIAFGHRRWRATKLLGIKVKAIVRDLSDEELVVAQGQENNARSDLTFIEKARFVTALEDRGFSRPVITASTGIHLTDLSTMMAIARGLPGGVVESIGKAPAIGRPRWLQLQKALADQAALSRINELIKTEQFLQLQTDARFAAALKEAEQRAPTKKSEDWVDPKGRRLVVIDRAAKKSSVHFDTAADAGFAEYVVEKLNDLYAAYKQTSA